MYYEAMLVITVSLHYFEELLKCTERVPYVFLSDVVCRCGRKLSDVRLEMECGGKWEPTHIYSIMITQPTFFIPITLLMRVSCCRQVQSAVNMNRYYIILSVYYGGAEYGWGINVEYYGSKKNADSYSIGYEYDETPTILRIDPYHAIVPPPYLRSSPVFRELPFNAALNLISNLV
jgi:hypothetical protein